MKTYAVIFYPVNRKRGEIFGGTIKAKNKKDAKAIVSASGRTANYRGFKVQETT